MKKFSQKTIDGIRRDKKLWLEWFEYHARKTGNSKFNPKVTGNDWIALCPRPHGGKIEKTPSLRIHQGIDGIYFAKCFGCGKSTTFIEFTMEMHDLPFPKAIQRILKSRPPRKFVWVDPAQLKIPFTQ